MNVRKMINEYFEGPENAKLRNAIHAKAKICPNAVLSVQYDFFPLTTRQLNRLGEINKELHLRKMREEQDRW